MNLLLNKARLGGIIISLFIVSGCQDDKKIDLTKEQWQTEIQKRFDIINDTGHRAECLVLNGIEQFPYKTMKSSEADERRLNFLFKLSELGLLSESFSMEQHPYYNERVMMYEYALTEQGENYIAHWPQINKVGFCFGQIVIDEVTKINRSSDGTYNITFQYSMLNVPDGIQDVLSQFKSYINQEPKQKSATFRMNENGQLYCQYGIDLAITE